MRRRDVAIADREHAGFGLRAQIGGEFGDADRGAGFVKDLADLGHAVGDRDHGAQRRRFLGTAQKFDDSRRRAG